METTSLPTTNPNILTITTLAARNGWTITHTSFSITLTKDATRVLIQLHNGGNFCPQHSTIKTLKAIREVVA